MRLFFYFFLFYLFEITDAVAQVKFIVEDFEGYCNGKVDLRKNGLFSFGNIDLDIAEFESATDQINGDRYLKIMASGDRKFGGWGKGLGMNVELNKTTDYFNFFSRIKSTEKKQLIRIEIQEDDNGNDRFDSLFDDIWVYAIELNNDDWKFNSISLQDFKDNNRGGDSLFNITYREGKIFSIIFHFIPNGIQQIKMDVDEIHFSKGEWSNMANEKSNKSLTSLSGFCTLGAWSSNQKYDDYLNVEEDFYSMFDQAGIKRNKSLGVIHFFQPFSFSDKINLVCLPDKDRINSVIHNGYLPMITLENHFSQQKKIDKQPDLNAIISGEFDSFLFSWAKEIQKLDGMVFLRILHEFNGDWYPWCVARNGRDPRLLINAFRHIHDIFKQIGVENVKFIWCPNSMSVPQQPWNFVVNAYPGDEYVDFIGVDVYNGAGIGKVWRSFRKEINEFYFLMNEYFSSKQIIVCEIASRERQTTETVFSCQSKAEWIYQMSQIIKNQMPKIVMLVWFNESSEFRLNSSRESIESFHNNILKSDWFKSGLDFVYLLLR